MPDMWEWQDDGKYCRLGSVILACVEPKGASYHGISFVSGSSFNARTQAEVIKQIDNHLWHRTVEIAAGWHLRWIGNDCYWGDCKLATFAKMPDESFKHITYYKFDEPANSYGQEQTKDLIERDIYEWSVRALKAKTTAVTEGCKVQDN